MIPRLPTRPQNDLPAPGFFGRLIELGFQGEIETGEASRIVFSTDNSIYQVMPRAVLFPRGIEDLKIIASVLSEPGSAKIAIAPRGGGTGTNGQSLTDGVVVDCSRHMNRILEIDPVRRVARVEAGVVKDQLNRALEPYGLFFAPELSTSNRATIGGMVSTDACGQGSCLYGKTSNHVLGLRVVLTDGTDWWSRPLDPRALEEVKARPDQVGEIHRTVERIARERCDEIEATFPKLTRSMTGYDLAHIVREDGRFDLNAVLCGSEGTLALIAEAELNVLPIPTHSALILIRYGDFNAALEDARTLTALKVASIETVDEKVLDLAKRDIIWHSVARFIPDEGMNAANGINIVEVLGDDAGELSQNLAAMTLLLDTDGNPTRRGYNTVVDKAGIEAIWSMRKRAVGLLGNVQGPARPVPFVEDTAVPPEHLASYIREFRELLDGEGLSYGMFGHVDAGVLHVRPALDMTRPDHERLVRKISDAVVALTRKYGGVLWGEHGKGVRSEYVQEFFGPLYPCLQDIKRAFDPANQLNPGKIASPNGAALMRIDDVPTRGGLDRVIGADIRAAFGNAAYCNGNGACFDFDETSPMCPSYKATRDRRYSPKGRASLLREWLRQLAELGIDPREESKQLGRSSPVSSLLLRTFNSLNPVNRHDFSHEVRAAMDTCLACKACAGQCPVKMDVPAFRAKFLELYYGRYLRPLKDPLVGAIETLLPIMAEAKPVYNLLAGTRGGRALMKLAGLAVLPRLPESGLPAAAFATCEELERLSPEERAGAVVFLPDAFTTYFDPTVVSACLELAAKMGFTPYLLALPGNGKALHVHGYLDRFARMAEETSHRLDRLSRLGVSLIGIDPSMTLVFRNEYQDVPAARPEAKVMLPQEWLCQNLDRLTVRGEGAKDETFHLLIHCTERTNTPAALYQWKAVFAALGIGLVTPASGCCGMAGTFGHEARNRVISEKLYAMSWESLVDRAAGDAVLMATGYSCRSQVKEIDGRAIPHPLQVINQLVS